MLITKLLLKDDAQKFIKVLF